MWHIYIGVAIEDKVYDSRLLKVHVTELTPYIVGDLKDLTGVESVTIENDDKKEKESIEVKSTNVIHCEYFGLDTNRVFPPDVRKGEQVLVIKYSDADKHYWIPLGRDDRLRRKEVYRIAVSNSDEIDKDLNEDNTYYVEIDTLHKKKITITTSKSDGEKFKYSIFVDSKKNFVSIFDDIGNQIILESEIPRIKLKNSEGTIVDLNTTNIFMMAKDDVSIIAGKTFSIKAKNEYHQVEQIYENKALKHTLENSGGTSILTPIVDLPTAILSVKTLIETSLLVLSSVTVGTILNNNIPGRVNYEDGVGEEIDPSVAVPNTGLPSARAATAWEQIQPALIKIQECLAILNGADHRVLPSDFTTISALGAASKMTATKGL